MLNENDSANDVVNDTTNGTDYTKIDMYSPSTQDAEQYSGSQETLDEHEKVQPLPQAGQPASWAQQTQAGTYASSAPNGSVPPPVAQPPVRRGPSTASIALLAVVLLLVFGTGLFAGWQFGRGGVSVPSSSQAGLQTDSSSHSQVTIPALSDNNIQTVREAVVTNIQPAVVQISTGSSLGSGVVIDKRGYIVTNNHVVENAQSLTVKLFDGNQLSATLVGTDATDDLAVVKINPPANLATANLGDSSSLKVGQEVLAVGNPLGNSQTVTHGIVSALGRNVSEGNGATIPNTIQTDAPINPGNSGGALVDLQGNVIGIPTLVAINSEFNTPANGVGYAIPSNRVKFIATQLINGGKVTHTGRAALNVTVVAVDASMAQRNGLAVQQGVMIVEVTQDGAAAKAGLQVNDVIVQVDNKNVTDSSSLSDALLSKNVGDKVAVKVYRGNQQLTINVALGELQAQTK
ncbi:S1C family serine protease [Ktedonobacter robiniae]|uniref:PDZ domain-containing protein n=1 Tax=Ktedonobacter robiniae TaxID=2778365 RepID=A0ABQ3UNF7_9CHLR|nr:trypsin-like peptidase domain-containing protein [Ktedonobacter robiniae]GHO54210.1 hypothetical protein KSB_26850 [Ktedonobacter robiniae]